MARKKIVAGNWKMNMTPSQAVKLVEELNIKFAVTWLYQSVTVTHKILLHSLLQYILYELILLTVKEQYQDIHCGVHTILKVSHSGSDTFVFIVFQLFKSILNDSSVNTGGKLFLILTVTSC